MTLRDPPSLLLYPRMGLALPSVAELVFIITIVSLTYNFTQGRNVISHALSNLQRKKAMAARTGTCISKFQISRTWCPWTCGKQGHEVLVTSCFLALAQESGWPVLYLAISYSFICHWLRSGATLNYWVALRAVNVYLFTRLTDQWYLNGL